MIRYVGGMLSFECHVPVLLLGVGKTSVVIRYVGGMLSFESHVPVLLLGVEKMSVHGDLFCWWDVKF